MKIAVTGGSGHIGGNLLRALCARGDQVRVLVREDHRSLDGLGVEQVKGDILDPKPVREVVDGAELVFHLAAQIAIGGLEDLSVERNNIGGTKNVLAACRDARVRRLVHFSSIHALSPLPHAAVVDETRALNEGGPGTTPYDRSKAQSEREVHAAVAEGLDAVIVNPTAVIGPHDYKPSAVGTMLLDLLGRRLPALVDGGFDWVDARDVAAGAIAAAERGRKGERYLLSGKWRSLSDLASLVQEATGVRPPRFVCPMWLARAGAPFATAWSRAMRTSPRFTSASLKALREHREISHEKAARELDYRVRPLEETLADTFRWFTERRQAVADGPPAKEGAGSDG
ncbi:MAG: NAD-dependent epimerase/dehydratase family protein [Myxococcales bacterium]|nr:NAD-dependent epimerase/dehydratase family protein [Myxococcales bacterium]